MKKTNNFQKNLKKLKELWSIPRYRAIIKLSLYGIMFLILIMMINIYNETNNTSDALNEEKSYTEIIKATDLENIKIEYNIKNNNEYKIDAKIINNILTGYLETNDTIKKIKLEENIIYNILNNTNLIDEELNYTLIKEFLLPKNIVELIKNETVYIEKTEDTKVYTYNINYNNINYEIKLTTNLETITNINIKNNDIEYNLNLFFDKN